LFVFVASASAFSALTRKRYLQTEDA